jgi:hypothetical protein
LGDGNPDDAGLSGNGGRNAADDESVGCPNLALLALQSATNCGSTFGSGLRAVGGCGATCMMGIMQ